MFRSQIISVLALIFGLTACTNATSNKSENVISNPTELSFHMVREESNSETAMQLAVEGKVPPGAAFYKEKNGRGLIVEKLTKVNQNCLDMVSSSKHAVTDAYIINFKFDTVCTKIFGEVSSKNIGKRFAIVLNGEIIIAPRIQAAIHSGVGFVEGGFTQDAAEKIVQDLLPYVEANKLKNSKK